MSKFMMVPRKVGEYHEGLNLITLDLLKSIKKGRDVDTSTYSDVPSLLFKWAFECRLTFFFFFCSEASVTVKINLGVDICILH